MAVMRYVGVIVAKGSLIVNLYSQSYGYMMPPLARLWIIRRSRALQGHRSEAKDLWCMVCPMRPFFWFFDVEGG